MNALPAGSAAGVPIAEPAPGADNYEVGREIARGGMGSVMEARDGKLARTVAVKIMLQDADADPVMRLRFLREAEVLAMLAHPNIVPIYDIVWEDGLPLFYCMKLVKGRTLQAILGDLRRADSETRRDFTLGRLLQIFRKVCDAIAFAHSKRVLHRDLKPENIMVGEFGEVMVMDWGLAKKMGDSSWLDPISSATQAPDSFGVTLQGAIVGTPHYMSPEQALGRNDDIDERSDVYALGGILYAILTLHPPVDGTTMEEVLENVKKSSLTTPEQRAKQGLNVDPARTNQAPDAGRATPGIVPAALSAVAMKALNADKARRYATVTALDGEIEAYQNGFATRAQQAGLGKVLLLFILRHKAVTALLATFLLLSVGFVGKLIASERRAIASEGIAVEEKQATRRALALARITLTESALREGDGTAMQTALGEVPPDLRTPDWDYLFRESDTSLRQLPDALTAAADPTRAGVFAIAGSGGRVSILKVGTGERMLEFTPEFPALGGPPGKMPVAFSLDGKWIAVARGTGGGIALHEARSGNFVRSWATPPSTYLEFGPGGLLLRFGLKPVESPKSMEVWSAATGTMLWQEQSIHGVGVQGTFRPGNGQILKYSYLKGLQLVNASNGDLIRQFEPKHEAYHWAMRIHPDGQTVFFCNFQGLITCMDLESGQKRFELAPKLPSFGPGLGLTPDGDFLITGYHTAVGRQVLQLWNAHTGAFIQSVTGGEGPLESLLVHSLSGELLVPGARARVWNLHSPPALLKASSSRQSGLAFLGTDNLVFCGNTRPEGGDWGLNQIRADGLQRLWTPPTYMQCKADVLRDGSLAAVMVPPQYSDMQIIRLLRKSSTTDGEFLEKISEIRPPSYVRHLRLSPSGKLIVLSNGSEGHSSVTGPKLQIFNTMGSLPGHPMEGGDSMNVVDCGWLQGDAHLAGLVRDENQSSLFLWEAASGKIMRKIPHDTGLQALAIAPDGLQLAEAGEDSKVRIRDGATLAILKEFRTHNGPVTALAWHPHRPVLATASSDLTIRVWDLGTQQMTHEWRTLERPQRLLFSPTGKRLVCESNADGGHDQLWEWEASPANEAGTPRLPLQDFIAPLSPVPGEIPKTSWKILRVSSTERDSPGGQAIDGNPATLWHSRWTSDPAPPPHELLIDLGMEHDIRGLVYLGMHQLTLSVAKDIEFSVSQDPGSFPPATPGLVKRVPSPQVLPCPAQRGRYVLIRILSSHGGTPVGTAAEIGVIGE